MNKLSTLSVILIVILSLGSLSAADPAPASTKTIPEDLPPLSAFVLSVAPGFRYNPAAKVDEEYLIAKVRTIDPRPEMPPFDPHGKPIYVVMSNYDVKSEDYIQLQHLAEPIPLDFMKVEAVIARSEIRHKGVVVKSASPIASKP